MLNCKLFLRFSQKILGLLFFRQALRGQEATLRAAKVLVLNGATIQARFYLTNLDHGTYDVLLTNPGDQSTIAKQTITVETALPLTAQVLPDQVNNHPRVGTPFKWSGAVVNLGNTDIPYLSINVGNSEGLRAEVFSPPQAITSQSSTGDLSLFILRDLSPYGLKEFSFSISGFGAHQRFSYDIKARPQTKREFLSEVVRSAEAVRDYIIANSEPGAFPTNLVSVFMDDDAWVEFYAQSLVPSKLLEEEDVGSLPLLSAQENSQSSAMRAQITNDPCLVCNLAYDTAKAALNAMFLLELAECAHESLLCGEAAPACFAACSAKALFIHYTLERIIEAENERCLDACRHPQDCPGNSHCVDPWQPGDPNEKDGPVGYGSSKFVGMERPLLYSIYFENVSSATAHARQIHITDKLDARLDARTFRLRDIVLGGRMIRVLKDRSFYQEQMLLPFPDSANLQAEVVAALDQETGEAFWALNAIDVTTGELVIDTQEGLLPPNDELHRGEGYVTFTVQPASGAQTGMIVSNSATIVFDNNEPIETAPVWNTIDAGAPSSSVAVLATSVGTTNFMVSWSGADDAGGSGVQGYDIYVSEDDAPFQLWLPNTPGTAAEFIGRSGRSYAFYSVARDNVGNVEGAPETPDSVTQVIMNSPPVLDAVQDQNVIVGESLSLTNRFTDPDGTNQTYSFELVRGPAGLNLNRNTGVLNWVPTCAQGSSTNVISISVTDSGVPSLSATQTFTVTVVECVEARLGEVVMEAGTRASVPIHLLSTVELTNLSFRVTYPRNRFTDFSVEPGDSGFPSSFRTGNPTGEVFVSFDLPAETIIRGPTNVGDLRFSAMPVQPSGFLSFPVVTVDGRKPDGQRVANAFGVPGKVTLISNEPLLGAEGAGRTNLQLVVFSQPDRQIDLLTAFDLGAGVEWKTNRTILTDSLVTRLPIDPATNRMQYFRAIRR